MNPILGINFLQIIYHIFNFSILGLGLYILLYKPVVNFMDNRKSYYEAMDQKAKENLASAENLLKDHEEKLEDFQKEKADLKAEAQVAAKKEADEIIAKAKKEEENILAKAKMSADFEREKIIKAGKEEVKDLLVAAIEKSASEDQDPYDAFIHAFGKED